MVSKEIDGSLEPHSQLVLLWMLPWHPRLGRDGVLAHAALVLLKVALVSHVILSGHGWRVCIWRSVHGWVTGHSYFSGRNVRVGLKYIEVVRLLTEKRQCTLYGRMGLGIFGRFCDRWSLIFKATILSAARWRWSVQACLYSTFTVSNDVFAHVSHPSPRWRG